MKVNKDLNIIADGENIITGDYEIKSSRNH